MKYTLLSLLAFGVAAVTATALPQPAPEQDSAALETRWCTARGRACWKVKRASTSLPEAESDANDDHSDAAALEARWCAARGRACWKVKRAAADFASSLASSGPAAVGADAEASNAPGGAAHAAKRAIDGLAGLVAGTQAAPQAFYDALGLGEHFEPDAEDDGGKPGPARRDLDARWCAARGRACWKVKRAAETLARTADAFEPDEAGRVGRRWCTAAGRACWKRSEDVTDVERRCNAPGGLCANARRDLAAMHHAARSVLEDLERV